MFTSGMSDSGGLFMFGFYGRKPSKETISLLKKTGACGVLLLGRNIETPAQTRALVEEFQQRLGRLLIIAVDHEGGWVLRFKSGVTAFPGNAALGRAGDADLAYAVGTWMARELSAAGITLNLAPVLDVVGAYNPGIGIRSFGADPQRTAALGSALIKGLQEHGVSACAKHFPGKGAAVVDAHVELPTINLKPAEFRRAHLAPFAAAVAAGVDCVMSSHVRFPALDRLPATFSPLITKNILRGELGFEGAVISDDLCMGAITRRWPIQIASLKALQAGHDILLIAHDLSAQRESVDLLEAQAQEGLIDPETLSRSRERISRLLNTPRKTASPDLVKAAALSRRIARRAVEVLSSSGAPLPLRPGSPCLLLFPNFSEVRELFTFEDGPRGPESLMRRLAARWGPAAVRRAPVLTLDLGSLPAAIDKAGPVVFFCFEARRFPGQKALLKMLATRAKRRTVICLIRDPWDIELIPDGMTVLDAKGFRNSSLAAAWDSVCGVHSEDSL